MAITGKQVFDIAMGLMDEVQENGAISTDNPMYYQTKVLQIINTLHTELLPPSAPVTVMTNLTQNLSLSDRMALMVLPYGVAAHLLLHEGDSAAGIASFFNSRYEELKRKQLTSIKPIEDVYNVLGGIK